MKRIRLRFSLSLPNGRMKSEGGVSMIEIHCPNCGKYCQMLESLTEIPSDKAESAIFGCDRCGKKWKIEISEVVNET